MEDQRASSPCAVCGDSITDETDSWEHVILEAIGGRLQVRGILHGICNNVTGSTWDAALARQLQSLALFFHVKRQKGQTPSLEIATTAGEKLRLNPGGSLSLPRPSFSKESTPEGVKVQIAARSTKEARRMLTELSWKVLGIDVDEALTRGRSQTSYPRGMIPFDLEIGGPESGRSIAKSALALAHRAGIPIENCGDALRYLRQPEARHCYGLYFQSDLVADRPAEVPLHCVAVEANPETGLVLGYIEYFGIHRLVVCLGKGFEGELVTDAYGLDPRVGKRLNLAVRLGFSQEEVDAIFEGKMVPDGSRQAALAQVFVPELQRQHLAEKDRVLQEASENARANCGWVEGPLTEEQAWKFSRLFAESVTPLILHAHSAREHAEKRREEARRAADLD